MIWQAASASVQFIYPPSFSLHSIYLRSKYSNKIENPFIRYLMALRAKHLSLVNLKQVWQGFFDTSFTFFTSQKAPEGQSKAYMASPLPVCRRGNPPPDLLDQRHQIQHPDYTVLLQWKHQPPCLPGTSNPHTTSTGCVWRILFMLLVYGWWPIGMHHTV